MAQDADTLSRRIRRVMMDLSSIAVRIAEPERQFFPIREHQHAQEAHRVARCAAAKP
jgi:hypothetical protein